MHDHSKGDVPIHYRGSFRFIKDVTVVVNGVTFWVDGDTNEFYFRYNDWLSRQYMGDRLVRSWQDADEERQVVAALLAAHNRGGYGGERPIFNQEAFNERQKAETWKMAFWLLLAAVVLILLKTLNVG